MKRLTLFFAALLAATMSFATVTYELNGGVTNDYGWCDADSMFATFMAESGATGFNTLSYYKQQPDPLGAPNICSVLLNPENCFNNAEKWGWLKTYIMGVHADQAADGASALADAGSGAAWRYAVGAFFVDGQRASWPKSANFAACGAGTPSAYMSVWQHAFANPTEPTGTFTLNAPYKEGYVFAGWYDNPQFTGAKVTTVDANTTGTLYARYFDVPVVDIATAKASTDSVYVAGNVNFASGKKVYIQDATGGYYLYFKTAPTLNVGDFVIAYGNPETYAGAPELNGATLYTSEAGTAYAAQTLLISSIKAEELKYFGQAVNVEGVKITSYYTDSRSNTYPYVTDGQDTIYVYIALDQTAFPVGKRVDIKGAVVGYYNGVQLVGDASAVTVVAAAGTDPATYNQVEVEGVHYNLTNNWLYSMNLENYASNKPNETAEGCRAMLVKDGIMYFPFCSAGTHSGPNYLVRYDAATGEKLDALAVSPEVFQKPDSAGNFTAGYVFHPFSDMKMDNAGNVIACNLPTGGADWQVWVVDVTTGAGRCLINSCDSANYLKNIFSDDPTIRLDRIGVYGDINGDAIIMSVSNSSAYVYYWNIVDGVWDGEHNHIACDLREGNTFGDASFVQPIEGDLFYVDGFKTYPYLIDMDGNVLDYFDEAHGADALTIGASGVARATGHNGVFEFEAAGEYFLLTAGDNTVGAGGAACTFVLYKCKDANRAFNEMTQLWEFPAAGMGAVSNPQRVAVPYAVKANDNEFTIYVYTAENGFGSYTFTTDKQDTPAVTDMWIIGECATAAWLPGASKKMTKTADGVFEVEETITGSWFAFVTSIENCTATTTDWEVINSHRFGSNPSGENISDGAAHNISGVNGDYSFTISSGTYKFVVDVNAMTVTATPVSAVENVEAVETVKALEDNQVVIMRNGVKYNVLGTVIK